MSFSHVILYLSVNFALTGLYKYDFVRFYFTPTNTLVVFEFDQKNNLRNKTFFIYYCVGF